MNFWTHQHLVCLFKFWKQFIPHIGLLPNLLTGWPKKLPALIKAQSWLRASSWHSQQYKQPNHLALVSRGIPCYLKGLRKISMLWQAVLRELQRRLIALIWEAAGIEIQLMSLSASRLLYHQGRWQKLAWSESMHSSFCLSPSNGQVWEAVCKLMRRLQKNSVSPYSQRQPGAHL